MLQTQGKRTIVRLGVCREFLICSKRLRTIGVLAAVGFGTRRGMDGADMLSKSVMLGKCSITMFLSALQ